MTKDQEIIEARNKFKNEGFTGVFVKPTIKYWKEHPWSSIFTFFLWCFISYFVFSSLMSMNNDLIYCDSNVGIEGRYMEVFPIWIEYNYNMSINNSYRFNNNNLSFINCTYQFNKYVENGFVSNVNNYYSNMKYLLVMKWMPKQKKI